MPRSRPGGKSAAGVEWPMPPRVILEGLEETVLAFDPAGGLVFANPAAAGLLGGDAEVFHETWRELVAANPWLSEALARAMTQAGKQVYYMVPLARGAGNGENVLVTVVVTPLFSAEGAVSGTVVQIRDESSLAHMSEAMRREDRLRQLGILAAGLAHEIKNPLGGILGAAQLLRSEALADDARECLAVIDRDVRRINRLLEELLDFGNPRALNMAPVNIHRLLDAVLETLLRDPAFSGREVHRDYDPSLPDVVADSDALQQVAVNLIKNAFEASPPAEPVVVRTRIEIGGRRIAARRVVNVEIQNGGPGLSAEAKEKLFTPFFTTKTSGTGLGLAISLRLLREHGGVLEVDSGEGKTVFTMVLPLEGPSRGAASGAPAGDGGPA